jgi:hypothetical protein
MGLPYDEQSGMTFTQDFSSLTFNVTAVAQTGPDGDGPAYLLSGLTDVGYGYWYQVGLSYKWPGTSGGHLPGFSMNYEVFDAYSGSSIYPTYGGGGIENFTVPVSQRDLVLLSLSFDNNGNVTMSAYDWNTTSSATQSFFSYASFYGQSQLYFVGTPSTSLNGFFTGLMTEQYYSNPYKLAGQPVVYSDSDFNYSAATLWIDEWDPTTYQSVFAAQTNGPIDLNSTSKDVWPGYLSSNGTSVAASEHAFATGLQSIHHVSAHISSPATIHPGDTPALNLTLNNPDQTSDRLTNVTLATDFGDFSVTNPIDLSPGTTNHSISITIPRDLGIGDHTATVLGALQVYETKLNAWISAGTVETTTTLTTTSPQKSAGLTEILQSLLPEIIAIIAILAIVIATSALAISRRKPSQAPPMPPNFLQPLAFCTRCGQRLASGTMFCPNCGNPLSSAGGQLGSGSNTDPSGPPPG